MPIKKNKNPQKDTVRSKYEDHSNKFLDYVNSLEIEKTWIGRVLFILEERFRLRRLFLVIVFSFVLALLLTMNFEFAYTGYKQDDIASRDVKSPISFEFVDEVETAMRKKAAEDAVPPVYDYDLSAYEPIIQGVYKSFREMRSLLGNRPWPKNQIQRDERIKDFLVNKDKFDASLGTSQIPLKTFEALVEKRFSVLYENIIIRLLDRIAAKKIIHDLNMFDEIELKQLVVRVVERGGGGEEFSVQIQDVQETFQVKSAINVEDIRGSQYLSDRDKEVIFQFVRRLIIPNLTPNKQETANRKQKAREAIPAVVVSIAKNQTVVSEGTVIQPSHVRVLDEISRRDSAGQRDFEAIILALFFVSIILVFFSYVRRFSQNRVRIAPKDLSIMGTVTLLVVVLSKFILFLFVETMQDRFAIIPSSAYQYLLPIAAGPMLVGLLLYSGEIVWLFVIFLSAALGFMMDMSFSYFVYAAIGGIAAARGVYSCKKRNDIYVAGLRVGAVNVVVTILLTVLSTQLQQGIPLGNQIFWNALAGLLSGVFAAFVAMTLIPLLETVFNCTTDVKLLELSNLNHPLLKDMSVNALGTYHHSLVVGNMVETAAEAIGANSLLCRVAAYYHDIGKTEHANYFIENQRPGHNPHDHLSPHMSKTILIAHVKDGVELGLKHKLGKPIIDVISQHHGTTLISFFYNRALENQDEDLHEVSEDEFRYPGPKPQFKEAALCMLADSIEAAARVLDEPQPMRIRNLVKTIIQRKFMDGQLDECNLTLRDLSIIENCFVRVLIGIHHQRIDYPKSMGGIGKD